MASAGRGVLANVPWAAITNNQFEDNNLGIDIAFLFKPDMSGVYLSFRVYFYQELQDKYGKYLSVYIKNKTNHIREFLIENDKDNDFLVNIDLGGEGLAKIHSLGTVFAKYYEANNIPSTEELVSDINYFLELYDYFLENYEDKTDISVDEWVEVLSNKEIIDSKMYSVLKIMDEFENKSAIYSKIAEKREELGFTNEKSYNSLIVSNSRRVKEFLNKKAIFGDDGKEIFWMRFFYGQKQKEGFEFKLRDELVEALKIVDRKGSVKVSEYNSFYEYLTDNGYMFDKETIENYLLSLKVKPFAILTGNSGTGKTRLSQLFAKYLNNKEISSSDSILTQVTVGKSYSSKGWALNKYDVESLVPLDSEGEYSVTVDGIPSKASLQVNPRLFYKSNDLKEHLAQLAEEDDKQKVPLEIFVDDNLIKNKDDGYIQVKVKASTILKNNEAAIQNKYLNNYLPINDYLGHFNGFIDDIPAEMGLNLVSYLRFKKKFIRDYIEPNYSMDDIIDIKINLADIIDFLPKPNFKGFTEFRFSTGSLPKFRLRHMSKEDHINFFNLDDKLRDCEVIINGESTVAKFYLFDSIVCLKNDEVDAYFEELSQRNKENIVTIKLNLDSFKRLKDEDIGEEFDDLDMGVDSLENEENYKIIPVGANWTENRNIVGYYNIITNKYESTPAYDLIKQAQSNPEPHFLILDEMNLSHVERYFADFLSAIESKENIPLYGEKELEIPSNLFIIGTVNVDETTYMFSPKVLDRANVLEFETPSARDYILGNIDNEAPDGDLSYLEDPMAGCEVRNYDIDKLRSAFEGVKFDGKDFWEVLSLEIDKFQTILKGSGFEFGFRVINEIIRFMLVAWIYEGSPEEWNGWERYFDAQIKQKILPKLHGSEKIIGETLEKLYKECLDTVIDDKEMKKYPESSEKLKEMMDVLRKQRYVSFIN